MATTELVTTNWFLIFWDIVNLILRLIILAAIVMGIIKGACYIKKIIKFIDKAERYIDEKDVANVMNCMIASLYVCVKDMERAVKFYEDFFACPVTERDDIYSVFDIGGFRYGLFAYQKMNEEHVFGSNCLPSIGFGNVDVLKAKISGKEICFPLTRIKNNWVAEFVDSEGNHIEVTAPVKE